MSDKVVVSTDGTELTFTENSDLGRYVKLLEDFKIDFTIEEQHSPNNLNHAIDITLKNTPDTNVGGYNNFMFEMRFSFNEGNFIRASVWE